MARENKISLQSNPKAFGKIESLYRQILDVFDAERERLNALGCDVCGSNNHVKQIKEFPDGPYLCLRHRCSWSGLWVRHGHGDVKLYFAKWLAGQLVPEAKKHATQ